MNRDRPTTFERLSKITRSSCYAAASLASTARWHPRFPYLSYTIFPFSFRIFLALLMMLLLPVLLLHSRVLHAWVGLLIHLRSHR